MKLALIEKITTISNEDALKQLLQLVNNLEQQYRETPESYHILSRPSTQINEHLHKLAE